MTDRSCPISRCGQFLESHMSMCGVCWGFVPREIKQLMRSATTYEARQHLRAKAVAAVEAELLRLEKAAALRKATP